MAVQLGLARQDHTREQETPIDGCSLAALCLNQSSHQSQFSGPPVARHFRRSHVLCRTSCCDVCAYKCFYLLSRLDLNLATSVCTVAFDYYITSKEHINNRTTSKALFHRIYINTAHTCSHSYDIKDIYKAVKMCCICCCSCILILKI